MKEFQRRKMLLFECKTMQLVCVQFSWANYFYFHCKKGKCVSNATPNIMKIQFLRYCVHENGPDRRTDNPKAKCFRHGSSSTRLLSLLSVFFFFLLEPGSRQQRITLFLLSWNKEKRPKALLEHFLVLWTQRHGVCWTNQWWSSQQTPPSECPYFQEEPQEPF